MVSSGYADELCSLLFELRRVGKAAGAASGVLQGSRRSPGHLKTFPDLHLRLASPPHLPAPSTVASKVRVLTGSGHALVPEALSSAPTPSQQLLSKQQVSATPPPPHGPGGVFLFILFYPSSSEECALFIQQLFIQQLMAHLFTFHLCGLSSRWNKCVQSVWVDLSSYAGTSSSAVARPPHLS